MTTVQQLLNEKGRDVFTVGPGETVFDAIRKMAEQNVPAWLFFHAGQCRAALPEQ